MRILGAYGTQAAFCAAANITPSMLSRIIHRQVAPSWFHKRAIEAALGRVRW